MKSAPFSAYTTQHTLGMLTMMLMAGLWQTRETRHPKTKSFVAEIFGDPNGYSAIAGLPYDTMFWGVISLMKNDDSVFRGVFNGFERLSIDISHLRYYTGYGVHVVTRSRGVRPERGARNCWALERCWQARGRSSVFESVKKTISRRGLVWR